MPTEFPQNERDWDEWVFDSADQFEVVLGRSPVTRKRESFSDLIEALNFAFRAEKEMRASRPMVYAVNAEGRQAMLVKDKWGHYVKKWKARKV
jgi:hypothetical protein